MISFRRTASWVLALSLVASFVQADEPTLGDWAQHRVEDGLVKPMAQLESRNFSRSRPPPRERRVRVLQTTTSLDKSKHAFVPFAIDVRFGGPEWRENDIVGCAYTASGKLFVKRGEIYRPASFLLGKNEAAVPGVCEADPARS